jgi:peptidoglycan/xylan/chitin deacetylase (PgdA/CDA1 family)
MYHSVAPAGALAPHGWLERLSVPLDLFEATLQDWDRRGVRAVGSDELRAFLEGRDDLPAGRVVLTFDDGYLDNWVAVTPLLRRYGQRAIVFVSTEFVDPTGEIRPTLDEPSEPLVWQGYLSAPEMRAMVETDLIEIQSHAATHTWEFISPRIVDFYGPHWNIEHPRCRYRFLWLNRHRELKPFALRHLHREAVPWGTPVYEFAPALVARRYVPDPALEARVVEKVDEAGGEAFFQRPDWREELQAEVARFRDRHGERGVLETDAQRRERIREELAGSRAFLEEITGRPVRFLSPPQGAADDETLDLARQCGFDLVTAPSTGRLRLNRRGSGRGWVHRCGTGYDLFGRSASRRGALGSQRIVLSRCSGGRVAKIVTKAAGALRRLKGRRPL